MITAPGVRDILTCAGYQLTLGPLNHDGLAVWGQRPSAGRGTLAAQLSGKGVLRVEDAFLRSLHPGRKHPSYGLFLDRSGVHFDTSSPSDVQTLLLSADLNDPALLSRSSDALARWLALGGGKYLAHDPDAPTPPEGAVVVVDQVAGDASVSASHADRQTFLTMLETARADHPVAPLVVKTHPTGRSGYFKPSDLKPGELWWPHATSPLRLLENTQALYTVSSQLGLDAIWFGLRPKVFGTPIYAGWGLSDDVQPLLKRSKPLHPQQLFAGLMLLAPFWYDPFRKERTEFETILDFAEVDQRAWLEDRHGYIGHRVSPWKRRRLRRMFGGAVRFRSGPPKALATPSLLWASRLKPDKRPPNTVAVEDGFLRSQGLGAELTPPMSLLADPLGLPFDPSRPSRLEQLIAASVTLSAADHARAERLINRLVAAGLTKYGADNRQVRLPDENPKVLVVGQVADDASVRLGANGQVRTNGALLRAARTAFPGAHLIYKPHPDVVADLRHGALSEADLSLPDTVIENANLTALLDQVDAVWTITSTLGFEALLRGVSVTCLGTPFYAGWGLTHDLAPAIDRRTKVKGVTLTGLVYAALIQAPRYFDPVTQRLCPVEVAVDRLIEGSSDRPATGLARLINLAWAKWERGL
ncbi:MAG: capsular polysaccharide biosynthesis protein [Pseudomonadota bacterium]